MKRKTETTTGKNVPWMVTLPKASKISGIPVGHLRKIIKSGKLGYYRAGDRYYIRVEELKDVLGMKMN